MSDHFKDPEVTISNPNTPLREAEWLSYLKDEDWEQIGSHLYLRKGTSYYVFTKGVPLVQVWPKDKIAYSISVPGLERHLLPRKTKIPPKNLLLPVLFYTAITGLLAFLLQRGVL